MMYTVIYVTTYIFSIFFIKNFMVGFFGTSDKSMPVKLCAYLSYPVIVCTLYLWVNLPIVNLIGNLAALFIISLLYKASMKRRITFCVFLYAFMIVVESAVVLLSDQISHSPQSGYDYSDPTGLIVMALVWYFISLVFRKLNKRQEHDIVSREEWLVIFFIPAASVYIVIVIAITQNLHALQGVVSVMIIFVINIVVFYIYEKLMSAYNIEMSRALVEREKRYYYEQCSYMEKSADELRSFRHDISNHLISIHELIKNGSPEAAERYIMNIYDSGIATSMLFSETGNIAIDSVLNYKLTQAESLGVRVRADISVPEGLLMDPTDITVITGNMLDNAINALKKLDEQQRELMVHIYYDRGRLFIIIKNSYDGVIKKDKGELKTTNTDRENHGIGLVNVKNSLMKYDGIIDFDYDERVFSAAAMMYVEAVKK